MHTDKIILVKLRLLLTLPVDLPIFSYAFSKITTYTGTQRFYDSIDTMLSQEGYSKKH